MSIRKFFKQLFCLHEWHMESQDIYNVNSSNGTKKGEVTLTILVCKKCDATEVVPSDFVK